MKDALIDADSELSSLRCFKDVQELWCLPKFSLQVFEVTVENLTRERFCPFAICFGLPLDLQMLITSPNLSVIYSCEFSPSLDSLTILFIRTSNAQSLVRRILFTDCKRENPAIHVVSLEEEILHHDTIQFTNLTFLFGICYNTEADIFVSDMHTKCVLQVSIETKKILPVIREIGEKRQDDGPSGKLNGPVGIASCENAI